ncbi:phage tail spike protein [Siminovitchia terrae]|uniref:phage tail spike protein n=1 Tax=Siminovitchia terrae TaxID=1914933 RepID=UPI0028ABD2EE|nr:phage tail spike protein [Siminovitchia terrae]
MSELYIFSQDGVLLTTLTESTGLVSALFRDEINSVASEPFVFTVDADVQSAKHVKEENRLVFKDKDGYFRETVIKELDDIDNDNGPQTTATCIPAWLDELNDNIVIEKQYTNKEAQLALDDALAGTRYEGEVKVSLGLASTNFNLLSSVDCIWKILEVWGGEFRDTIEIVGNNITVRKIIIEQRLGADKGARFEIDHNIEEIQRTVLSYPKTALYGWGASLEVTDGEENQTDGHTRYIDFGDVVWSKAKGDPTDKPKGQKWVGDPDALLKYGRKHNSQLLHRYGEFSNQDSEDPAELLQATWEALKQAKKPEVHYKLSVDLLDKNVSLGDTAVAIDRQFDRPIEIQTRIIAIEYDLLDIDGTTVVEMGQFLSVYDNDLYREIDNLKESIRNPKERLITNDSFPNIKPGTPMNVEANGAFQTVQLFWDYDSEVYIGHYEVYGSEVKDFVPDSQHLLWRGRTSSFVHEVETDQVWYYRVRAVNTRGTPGDFSPQVSAATVRIISDDILFGSVLADHLSNNLDIADKLAQNTIDRINAGPMQEIQYTQAEIQAAENRLLGQLNSQIGDVNESINDLLTRTSGIEGTVTSITQEVNDIDGRLSTTITQLTNIDGVVSENTTTLEAHAGMINAKAEKSEVYTRTQTNDLLGNKVDYTVYNNKMASLDIDINGIFNRVSNTETNVNSLTGDLSNAKSQIAQLDIRADGIVQSVSEVRADLDRLEIGGRNLAKKSDITRAGAPFTENNYVYRISNPNATTTTGLKIIKDIFEEGKYYVLSFKIKKISGDITSLAGHSVAFNEQRIYMDGQLISNSWTSSNNFYPNDNEVHEYVIYLKANDMSVSDANLYIQPNRAHYSTPYDVEIWDLQVEEGNKKTGWQPTPEDTDARITSAEASITTLAGQIELKASQTSVDSLTGRMFNAESSINLLSNEINLKVNKDGIIAGINISPETGIMIAGKWIHLSGQSQIDDAIIGTAAIANAAITRAKLGTAVVGTAQIENAAITDAKIASLSADKLTAGAIRGIDIYGAKFRSSSGTNWMEMVGGDIHLEQSNGRYMDIGPTGVYGYNAGGSVRFQADSSLVTSSAFGTSNGNVYLVTEDNGEARVVRYSSIPGSGSASDYQYRHIRALSFKSPPGANAYVGTDGELRIMSEGLATQGVYRNLRAKGLYANELEVNGGDVLYLRSNVRVRIMGKGSSSAYSDLQTNEIMAHSIRVNSETAGSNFYIGASDGELRVTSNGLWGGSHANTVYRNVRANGFYGAFFDQHGGVGGENIYVRPTSSGEARVTVAGSTTTYRPIRASSFPTGTSLRENKKDIEIFNDEVLSVIRNANPYLYRIKGDEYKEQKQLGLMVDETPRVLHGETGDSIEMYALGTYLWRGVQQLDTKVNNIADDVERLKIENQYLKQKIKQLEDKVA